jgi:hypothetical protein
MQSYFSTAMAHELERAASDSERTVSAEIRVLVREGLDRRRAMVERSSK